MKKHSSILQACLLISMALLTACVHKTSVPFPENASGFKPPVTKTFEYPEATPIVWEEVGKDTVPNVKVFPLNLDKLPSKSFTVNGFIKEDEPITKIPIPWDKLPEHPLNLDTVKTDTFAVKTFLLPKPTIIKVNPPTKYSRSTAGILQMGMEEGIPGNYIYETVMDKNGVIWVATERGLACYKGDFFELYEFLPDLTGINPGFIGEMIVDSQNNLWMCTQRNNLYHLNTSTGLVTHIELEIPFGRLAIDEAGKLWYTAFGTRMGIIDLKHQTIQKFTIPISIRGEDNFAGLTIDHTNNIWVGSRNKAYILNTDRTSYKVLEGQVNPNPPVIFDFYETKSGEMWLNSFMEGAVSVSADRKNIQILTKKQGFDGRAIDVVEDQLGKIWIFGNDTTFIYDPVKSRYKKIVTGINMVADRVPGMAIVDMDGNIWVGTPQNKMLLIDPSGGLPEHLNTSNGLYSNNVWGIDEDNEGLIWLGTYEGINIYDPHQHKSMLISTENGLSHNRRQNANLLKDGSMLMGGGNGFCIVNKKKKKLIEYETPLYVSFGFTNEDENIWLGCNDGLYVYNQSQNSLKKLAKFKDTPIGRVWDMVLDDDGLIWLSTFTGIFVLNTENETLFQFGIEQGYPNELVMAIQKSSIGELWVGGMGFSVINTAKKTITNVSAEQGLFPEALYDIAELNHRMYIGSQDGMILVERPAPEDSSQLWHFYNYNKRNGFPFNDYNQMTAHTLKNGQIWWGVTPQITVITDEPTVDSRKPKAYITGIGIMDQDPDFFTSRVHSKASHLPDTLWNWQFSDFQLASTIGPDSTYYAENNIQWDSISSLYYLPIGLKLPFDQNSVNFSFTNPEIKSRDKIAYRYFLEGVDKDWSRITPEPYSRNYYNLKHGTYVFKVATKGFNGVWSEPATFSFTILPPWWLTWPAYLSYFLLFIALVFIIDRIQRHRLLKKEREKAREKELEQAKKIEKAYNDLKATQAQLIQAEKMASLGELTAGIAHEIQNPLNFVNNFSEVNTELLAEMNEEIESGNIDEIKDLVQDLIGNEEKISYHGKRAEAIVKGMLLHSRGNSGQKELTDINALADEYLRLSFHGIRARDKSFNADFKLEMDETIPKLSVVPQDIGRVLLNLINNAFYAVTEKANQNTNGFSPTVWVSTKKRNSTIEIHVRDNGNGIPEHVKEKIFQPFFTTKPTGKGTGLGLSMSYDIIKAHDGIIKVESKEKAGTEFVISLPTN